MWTNKDPNAIGRLAKKDTLAKLIPGFKDKDKIIPYDERVKKGRAEQITNKDDLARELLLKSLEYSKENFKKSAIILDSKKTLEENLDLLTEEQLFEIQEILDFCHIPKDFGLWKVERLIVSIPDHDSMKLISTSLKKRIPAFEQRVELQRLETQETEIEKRKNDLKREITKAQGDFKKKVAKQEGSKPTFACIQCEKVCYSKAGLTSHMKTHEPKTDTKKSPKDLIQHSEDLVLS